MVSRMRALHHADRLDALRRLQRTEDAPGTNEAQADFSKRDHGLYCSPATYHVRTVQGQSRKDRSLAVT